MKRLAAPRTWPIARKSGERWVSKALPGAHKQGQCVPILIALRDMLKLASDAREVRRILHNNEVLVNNTRVKKLRFGIGLFDVLSIKKLNKHYRVVLTQKNKLALVEIKGTETNTIPLKVKSRTTLRGGKIQANFTNGWNLVSKSKYTAGNTVLFDLAKKKVGKELKLKKGSVVVVSAGKYVGRLAKIESLKSEGLLKKRKLAQLKPVGTGPIFTTIANGLLVVGETKPEFTANAK